MLQNSRNVSKDIENITMSIMLSEDGTEAYMEVNPNENSKENMTFSKVPKEELEAFLQENGIKYGLQEENILHLSESDIPTKSYLVAKGKEAIDGQDGTIKQYKKSSETVVLNEDDKGNINFKELEWFFQVSVGEILAEKTLPIEGEDGIDVYGAEIKARKGKNPSFKYGKNVGETPDGLQLMALKDGRVEYSGDKVQINDVLIIKGNVDTETGNIRFLGDVVVQGDIKSGFDVYCDGGLEVTGVIEAANVNIGKDLVVRGGIQGNTSFLVEAGGSIICKFIENASISSKGNIVTDFIVHSTVNCGGSITVKGKKGLVVGGEIRAKSDLTAQMIGSYMGTKTVIEIGVDPTKKERLEAYREEKNNYKNRLVILQPSIQNGKELLSRGLMDSVKKISFTKIVEEYNKIIQNLKIIDKEMEEIEAEILGNTQGYIVVKSRVYPGTKISIGRFNRHIKDEVAACKIFVSDNDILVSKV